MPFKISIMVQRDRKMVGMFTISRWVSSDKKTASIRSRRNIIGKNAGFRCLFKDQIIKDKEWWTVRAQISQLLWELVEERCRSGGETEKNWRIVSKNDPGEEFFIQTVKGWEIVHPI